MPQVLGRGGEGGRGGAEGGAGVRDRRASSRGRKCRNPQVLGSVADDVRQWFSTSYRSAAFSAAACALRAQAAAENTGFPLQVTSGGPNQPPTETLTRFPKP